MKYKITIFDYIILTKCWLENCIINFEIIGFTLYKTQENSFNQNSGIIVYVVYVNKQLKVNNVSEIIINYCNCL